MGCRRKTGVMQTPDVAGHCVIGQTHFLGEPDYREMGQGCDIGTSHELAHQPLMGEDFQTIEPADVIICFIAS